MTARYNHRLIGTDVICAFRRHDRVQRGLNTCELGLQLDESCVFVNNFALEPLVFGLDLPDLFSGSCKVTVTQIQAEYVSPNYATQREDNNGAAQQ